MKMDRAESAYRVRVEAAEQARHRPHPGHQANPDEKRYGFAHYLMSFTKGLEHRKDLGVVADPAHFQAFRTCIDEGFAEHFTSSVFVPTNPVSGRKLDRRPWEAPTAGIVYDLEGPDAQAVTMAPAPELGSDELTFEMAEVYELALLRDVPLASFSKDGGSHDPGNKVDASLSRLNAMRYAKDGFKGRPRKTGGGELDRQTVFRGSSPGVENGPYVSQFLWIGNKTTAGGCKVDVDKGFISYGPQVIDQRVSIAEDGDDYMQTWQDWLDVQDGYKVQEDGIGQNLTDNRRFIRTPRDLATYVHVDALYQAYLNATLILLAMGTPFDQGFAKLSGMRRMYGPRNSEGTARNAGGFALWGGPHILTLVTEVATRALKAVRYQKFNNHLRLRPEALAARVTRAEELEKAFPGLCGCLAKMRDDLNRKPEPEPEPEPDLDLESTLTEIAKYNWESNEENERKDPVIDSQKGNYLLPMAFAEGSPMHPSYGAGHATVAGACTTIVKAFFDTGTVLVGKERDENSNPESVGFRFPEISKGDKAVYYEPNDDGSELCNRWVEGEDRPLTLEGELNKLAANISIGRNMAGVHYFSDYYDSLRMGEEIAIGMLQEQAICYPTDDFVLTVPTFDGKQVRIGAR
ncbi:MAG: vanadium-dependent haloperoxidase [Rhodospirillales bacterium]|nr:vanadium-dependent haloperoxidase [Rhodospirillales bacterium]